MTRWYYIYVPLHVAGSRGVRLKAKLQATEEEIRQAFGHCAHIDGQVVDIFKRP